MKKKIYLAISIFFTSSLFAYDTYSNYDVLSDCVEVFLCAAIIHKAGYKTHSQLTRNFNDQNTCDRACAHCTGFVWNAYAIDRATAQNCPYRVLYIPMTVHNITKAVEEKFEKSAFDADYNRPAIYRMQ